MKKQAWLLAGCLLLTSVVPSTVRASNTANSIPPAKVESSSHAPISILDFTDITWPQDNAAGSDIPIRFSIRNNGSGAAKNIRIQAESEDLNGLAPKSVTTVNAKYFAPNQKETYSFLFKLSPDAEKKNYPIKLTVAYVDVNTNEVHESKQMVTVRSGGGSGTDSDSSDMPSFSGSDLSSGGFSGGDMGSPLPITGSEGAPSSGGQTPSGNNTPKLVIDHYSYDPVNVKAGVPFTLYFRILNTNSKKSVQNIRVALSADAAEAVDVPAQGGQGAQAASQAAASSAGGGGSAFIPIDSSNTFYVEKIKPKKHAEKEITLTTAPDTAPRTYTITANFEYEDANGNPYTSSEVIGIPVIQSAEIELGDLKVDKTGFVDGEMPLSLEFFNTGKSVLSNVMVKMRGNFDADTNTYFAGNVAPGSAQTYDVNITPRAKGEQKGEIVITYDDATGKKQELVKPFTVSVEGDMPVQEDEDSQNSRPAWVIPVGVLLIALAVGGIGFYVYKKRKKAATDDEDLTV
ncbi:MAG: hypothetical protein SOW18_02885 [Peptoniphilus sp.]|nr:hypothetical protein [Peptoniphilus sp.]MDY3118466.1 hypothetical protein [Peptoniphilus sp.]